MRRDERKIFGTSSLGKILFIALMSAMLVTTTVPTSSQAQAVAVAHGLKATAMTVLKNPNDWKAAASLFAGLVGVLATTCWNVFEDCPSKLTQEFQKIFGPDLHKTVIAYVYGQCRNVTKLVGFVPGVQGLCGHVLNMSPASTGATVSRLITTKPSGGNFGGNGLKPNPPPNNVPGLVPTNPREEKSLPEGQKIIMEYFKIKDCTTQKCESERKEFIEKLKKIYNPSNKVKFINDCKAAAKFLKGIKPETCDPSNFFGSGVNPFDPGAKATPTRVDTTSRKGNASGGESKSGQVNTVNSASNPPQGGDRKVAQSSQSESSTKTKFQRYKEKLLKFLRERSNKASDREQREMYSRTINSLAATEIIDEKKLIEWFKKQLLDTLKYGKSRTYVSRIEQAINALFSQKDITKRILDDQHMHLNIAVLFESLHDISKIPDSQERTIPVNKAVDLISNMWSTGYVPKGNTVNSTGNTQKPGPMNPRVFYSSTDALEKSMIEDAIRKLPNPNYDGKTPKGDARANQIHPSSLVLDNQRSLSSPTRMQMDNNALASESIRKVLEQLRKSGTISAYRELKGDGNMLYFEYKKEGNGKLFVIVPVPPIVGYKGIYVGSRDGFKELLEKNRTRIVFFENPNEAFRIIIGDGTHVLYDSSKPPVCRKNNARPAECKTAPNVWEKLEEQRGSKLKQETVPMNPTVYYTSTDQLRKSELEDAIRKLPNSNNFWKTPEGDAIPPESIRKVLDQWHKSGKIVYYRDIKDGNVQVYYEYKEYTARRDGKVFIVVPDPAIVGYKGPYVGTRDGFRKLLESNKTRIVRYKDPNHAFRMIIGESK
ncbi:MAG: hypothetical protein KGO83_00905 [Paenibacillaceae bacterium]|nr:hypothetical protein [Paenibacillaceae bacterium]